MKLILTDSYYIFIKIGGVDRHETIVSGNHDYTNLTYKSFFGFCMTATRFQQSSPHMCSVAHKVIISKSGFGRGDAQ